MSGETILVTDRDHVVAELHPPATTRSPEVSDAALAEMVREGVLTPALLPPREPLPARKPVGKLAEVLRDLADDREDR